MRIYHVQEVSGLCDVCTETVFEHENSANVLMT